MVCRNPVSCVCNILLGGSAAALGALACLVAAYGWLIRVGVVRYCRICWVGIALEYIGHERRSVHGTEHSVAALDWLHSFFPAHLVNHGPACATQCDAIGREAGRNICA